VARDLNAYIYAIRAQLIQAKYCWNSNHTPCINLYCGKALTDIHPKTFFDWKRYATQIGNALFPHAYARAFIFAMQLMW